MCIGMLNGIIIPEGFYAINKTKIITMKKTIWWYIAGGFLLLGVLIGWSINQEQAATWDITTKTTSIETECDSLVLGIVKYNEKREAVFLIKNTGTEPLIIKNVRPSCGCTSVNWDKHPVKPGNTTEISLIFEPNSLGRFIKSVDIFCNIPQQIYQVKIMGQVEEN